MDDSRLALPGPRKNNIITLIVTFKREASPAIRAGISHLGPLTWVVGRLVHSLNGYGTPGT